jgi:phage/conjugal plasmid C-4 type zinc finger TraR family protein
MSGYGRPDEEQENAQAIVDNAIALARMMIHKGESSKVCHDCGDPIPEARREAAPGCKYCIKCQPFYDRMPNVKVVTKML